jgi:hypothetical protein
VDAPLIIELFSANLHENYTQVFAVFWGKKIRGVQSLNVPAEGIFCTAVVLVSTAVTCF